MSIPSTVLEHETTATGLARPMRGHRRRTLATILALTALGYLPALFGPFVLDDVLLVTKNPRFGDFRSVLGFFTEPVEAFLPGGTKNAYYRPLSFLSLWLDQQIWGKTAAGFHLINLILHLLSSLLVFRLARRWFKDDERMALGVTAIWSIIPLHAETVSYIAARHDVLFLTLYLWALDVYTGGRGVRRQVLFGVLALAAFMAKEMAISLPVAAALHDVFHQEERARSWSQRLKRLLCPCVTLGVLFGVRIAVVGNATGSSPGLPDAVLVGSVGWHYLGMLASPLAYSIDRSRDVLIGLGPAAGFGLVVGIAIVASLFLFQRREAGIPRRNFVFGVTWALAAYLPVSHVVPLYTLCADRYLYLPLLPIVVAVAAVLTALVPLESVGIPTPTRRRVTRIALCLFLLLVTTTFWRSSAFINEQRLYETSLEVSPQSPLLHNNLGKIFSQRGKTQTAALHFGAALTTAPDYKEAQFNLGTVALRSRDFDLAETMFGKYLSGEHTRSDADAWRLWSLTALEAGRLEDARWRLNNAERLQPSHPSHKVLLDRVGD